MTSTTDITPEFFYSGLALSEYIEGMTKNRELFEQNYRNFRMTADELADVRSIKGALHVLVLTEDWCTDAIRYLPALVHMAEAAKQWDIRIFYRDAHPELAGRWLKHGTRSAIPVLVFLDGDWNEFACFVEKPEPVYPEEAVARADYATSHPDLPDAALPASEMSQTTLEIFTPYMRGFRLNNTDRWEHFLVTELAERLQNATSSEVSGVGCW
jgi:hypothetical protein